MPRLRWEAWWAVASAAAMILGAFGPWLKASAGFVSVSASGTDGSNDGWLVVVVAVVGGAAIVAADLRNNTWLPMLAGLAGVAGAVVAGYDRNNLQERIDEIDNVAVVQVGWGLNLVLAASISLVVACMVHLVRGGQVESRVEAQADPQSTPAESSPTDPASPVAASRIDDLERLAALRASGALSDEEFGSAKARLLKNA